MDRVEDPSPKFSQPGILYLLKVTYDKIFNIFEQSGKVPAGTKVYQIKISSSLRQMQNIYNKLRSIIPYDMKIEKDQSYWLGYFSIKTSETQWNMKTGRMVTWAP